MKPREIVEEALFYVGIPIATLYPLGFVGLGLQMWRDPLFPYASFDAVWEAVAMVPHIVVIATSIKLVYLSLISAVLGLGATLFTLHLLHLRSNRTGPGVQRRGLWGAYMLLLIPIAVFLLFSGVNVDRTNELLYLTGFVVFSAGSGALIGFMRSRNHEGVSLTTYVAAFSGVVAAALCVGALHTPSLPIVAVQSQVSGATGCSAPAQRTFVKLDETPGYWHLYNEAGMFSLNEEEIGVVRYQDCERFKNRN